MDNLKSEEKIKSKKFGFLEYVYTYFGFLVLLFAVNLPITLQVKMINMGSDEYNILSMAAYLTGTDWSSYNRSIDAYHGFGSALLYLPVFLFEKNVWKAYQLALYENIVLEAFMALIVYAILRKFFSKQRKIVSFGLALLTSMYPVYMTAGKFTWSETSVVLFCFLNIFFAIQMYDHYKDHMIPWTVASVLIAGYAYMIHGRNIIFPILCMWEQIYLFFKYRTDNKKTIIKRLIVFCMSGAVLLVFYKVNGIVIGYFKTNLWHADELRNTMETLATNRLGFLKDIDSIFLMFKATMGQLFYANAASLGFFSLFAGIVLTLIFKKNKNEIYAPYGFLVKYMALAYFISTSISIAGLISGIVTNTKWAYYVWGRYTEIHLSMIVLLCFLSVDFIGDFKKTARIGYWILITISILFLKFTLPNILRAGNNGGSTSITCLAVWLGYDLFNYFNYDLRRFVLDFYRLTLIIFAVTFVVYWFCNNKKRWIVYICMIAFYIYSFYYVSMQTVVPNAQRNYANMQKLEQLLDGCDLEGKNIYYISNENRYPSELQVNFYDSHIVLLYNPLDSTEIIRENMTDDMDIIISHNSRLENYIEYGFINPNIIADKEVRTSDIYTVYIGN
ncbi:MAG: hypothetical protein IKS56_08930 [Lachnospiraceae bacterium]|nr:hypothetical protein [Lachnospiraceae bacterium]